MIPHVGLHIDSATPTTTPRATVTLLGGAQMFICSGQGDVEVGGIHGYYVGDTRLVDQLRVLVGGVQSRPIDDRVVDGVLHSYATVGDPTRPDLLVVRRSELTSSLEVTVDVTNLRSEHVVVPVELVASADFADVFEVKRGVQSRFGYVGTGPREGALVLRYESGSFVRSVTIRCSCPAEVFRDSIQTTCTIEPRATATATFRFEADDAGVAAPALVGLSVDRRREWEAAAPRLETSSAVIECCYDQSITDLASLLLQSSEGSGEPVVAAGSPWFMALFGRDSLITSMATSLLGSSHALGTLSTLAQYQGVDTSRLSAEEPGKILHELRNGEAVTRPGGWGSVYYGSVDATPLFVMALAQAWRWGAPPERIAALLPAAERAVEWIGAHGDPDGDGFVEYVGTSSAEVNGLANQGWKDSHDAIRHPDGVVARGPIAVVEVQGYCHAALLALADLRDGFGGDPGDLRERARTLAERIDDAFWMDDEDCYALALDGEKRQVRSVSSNAGHLLWTGTAREDRVDRLIDRLLADDMFTGSGLRTLSQHNHGYNPLSYHCGSVWPHDSAMVATGMLRYGRDQPGQRLAVALLDAAAAMAGRPPELFGGFRTPAGVRPVPYPTSCSPQAWASASTAMLLTALVGVQPDVPNGRVSLTPRLPVGCSVELEGIRLGHHRLELSVYGRHVESVRAGSLAVDKGPRRSPASPSASDRVPDPS